MSTTTQQAEGGCVAAAAARLSEGEQAARTERFNLGHLSKLLLSLGEEIGEPRFDEPLTDLDCQDFGLRVEYVAHLIEVHADALAKALDIIETATDSLVEGGAQ